MDFRALLHLAKKKDDEAKQQKDGKYYCTKYSPPKKVSKESKQLSDNIQNFLKKKEAEEAEKRREKSQKVADLMAKRDEKSKTKIRRMLKVTKSANRSVLDDAKDSENTGTEHETGEGQGDDYGYTSSEANALYDKYMQKVQHVEETKGFAPSRPQLLHDLSATKERVKAALDRERQAAESHTRQRRGTSSSSSSTDTSQAASGSTKSNVARPFSTSKTLYDPEAEKSEEENKNRLAEQQKRAQLKRAAQPPPMDYQALLRLAERNQHEPVVFAQPEKEPERLLTAKEKLEAEERQRYREERAQRDKMRESGGGGGENKPKPTQGLNRMEPNGRIPKLSLSKPAPASSDAKVKAPLDTFKGTAPLPAKASGSSSSSSLSSSQSSHSASNRNPVGSTSSTNKIKVFSSAGSKPAEQAERSSSSGSSFKVPPLPLARNPFSTSNMKGAVRQFQPKDRPAGSGSMAKKPTRAPVDAKDKPSKQSPSGYKRRICDEESDYDSGPDDCIDNGDCEENISSHIRSIFGYDKRLYKDQDDDDLGMESSFAQMQREEFISKRLGRQEDLEDMRKEQLHRKEKMAKKRSKRFKDDSDEVD